MLWCRYLKSRTAIVASNSWASKYFELILLANLGFWDLSCKNTVLQVVIWCLPGFSVTACPKARPSFHCWNFLHAFYSLPYVIVCLWLMIVSSLRSISVLHGLSNTANCSRHNTFPSTNSRATICQCQWDATIHGYLGSLLAEQLLPIKKDLEHQMKMNKSLKVRGDQIKSSAGGMLWQKHG